LEHAAHIAANLRAGDAREVMASHGHMPLSAALASLQNSTFTYVGCADGVPFYLFGFRNGTAFQPTGTIWGLGTDELLKYRKSFWPASVNFVAYCRGHVDVLENFVHVDNHLSIAWLRRLGFQFDKPAPFGVEKREFMRFWMKGGFMDCRMKKEVRDV
jgi:hypothetical protein